MFKSCVQTGEILRITSRITFGFYTVSLSQINFVGKNRFYTQLYQQLTRALLHIKFSLNSSVKNYLSTVSTSPTIKPTKLIFDEIVIHNQGAK